MATITPSVESLTNTGSQNLFTINTVTTIPAVSGQTARFPAQLGATYYSTAATPAWVVFNTTAANVGTDITSNVSTGVFTLVSNAAITYNLSAFVNVTSTPATYGWINVGTGNAIGSTARAGTPLSTTFVNATGNAVNVAVQVQSVNSQPFAYPTQIQGAVATITEVSGFTS
jgi:hypothetical protein